MTPETFLYWLSGVLEFHDPSSAKSDQNILLIQGIKEHLKLITDKKTPEIPKGPIKRSDQVPDNKPVPRSGNGPIFWPDKISWPEFKPNDAGSIQYFLNNPNFGDTPGVDRGKLVC